MNNFVSGLFLAALMLTQEAMAQGTVYATSGMGRNGAGTARLQAQLAVEKDQREKANVCGNAGQLYGPNHAAADVSGCVTGLTIDGSGNIAVNGSIAATSDIITDGDVVAVGNVSAVDATFNGNITVNGTGTFVGRVELINGIRLSEAATCDAAGVLRYVGAKEEVQVCNGSEWLPIGTGAGAATCDFNFAEISGADVDTFYNTADAVYSGLSAIASVSGNAPNATIRRNASDTGLSSGVSINSSDLVGIRAKSSPNYNRIVTATMDVGDNFTACWNVTTKEQDVTPNAFSFADLTDQDLSTSVMSNTITPTGYDGPLNVAVGGDGSPELRVDGGAWVTSDSMNPSDTLQVRLTTSASTGTMRTANITLGTYQTDWAATTGVYAYSSWSGWGTCSASCGGGTQTRSRTCAFSGGSTTDCSVCGGVCSDSQSCNTQSCCVPNMGVSCGDCGYGTIQCNGSCVGDDDSCVGE